jgi:hypothetical protein
VADYWRLQDDSGYWILQDSSGNWQLQADAGADVFIVGLQAIELGIVAITAAGLGGVLQE